MLTALDALQRLREGRLNLYTTAPHLDSTGYRPLTSSRLAPEMPTGETKAQHRPDLLCV
jgi:hypothetical protein